MPYKDPAEQKEYNQKKNKNKKQHAYDSITSGSIIDRKI